MGRKRIYYYSAKEQLFRARFSYEFFAKHDGKHWTYNGVRLISPSAINAIAYSLDLGSIPESVLENRREIGSALMEHLKYMFDHKIEDIDNLMINDISKKHLYTIARFLKEYRYKVIDVEKFVCNNHFCGIVDMIVSFKSSDVSTRIKAIEVIEIKVRNSLEVKWQDYLQVSVYAMLLRTNNAKVLVIDDIGNYRVYEGKQVEHGEMLKLGIETFNKIYKKKLSIEPFQLAGEVNTGKRK